MASVKKLAAKPVSPDDPPRFKDPGLQERVTNLRALIRREPKITTTNSRFVVLNLWRDPSYQEM